MASEVLSTACCEEMATEVLTSIARCLIPSRGLSCASNSEWTDFISFVSTSHVMYAAAVEALRERVPVIFEAGLDPDPARTCALLGSLLTGGGQALWQAFRPLRAVRPSTMHTMPLQAPPRVSGASLCALAPQHLCLFGGRDSISGDTLGATRLVSVRSGVAVWDVLTSKTHPPARCYHTASLWPTARGSRQGSGVCLSMVVFGGAGDGDGEGNDWTGTRGLLSDLWSATVTVPDPSSAAAAGGATGRPCVPPPPLSWRPLEPRSERSPAARSSHVCAAWAAAGALVIHGGLSSGGVLGDTWLLSRGRDEGSGTEQCEWIEVVTSGACVQRAHHSGGVVAESTLLIFSGQV